MKKVLLLGASGSIGKQTIDIINKHNNLFDLVGFSVGYNVDYIDELLTSFTNIKGVYLIDDNQKQLYQNKYPNIQFYSSKDGFKKFIDHIDFDIAVDSLVWISGLVPAIEILKRNKILCLANKEALVTGGHLINDLLRLENKKLKDLEYHIKNDSCIEEFIDNLEIIKDFIKELEEVKEENGNIVVKCWYSNMGGYEYELIDF